VEARLLGPQSPIQHTSHVAQHETLTTFRVPTAVVDNPNPCLNGRGRKFGTKSAPFREASNESAQMSFRDGNGTHNNRGRVGYEGGSLYGKKTGVKSDSDDSDGDDDDKERGAGAGDDDNGGLALLLHAASGMKPKEAGFRDDSRSTQHTQSKRSTEPPPRSAPDVRAAAANAQPNSVAGGHYGAGGAQALQVRRGGDTFPVAVETQTHRPTTQPTYPPQIATSDPQRQFDVLVHVLSARCAELYVVLGPHEIVAKDLATLVVTLRSGGSRYHVQEKIVTGQLWELVRAMAFPSVLVGEIAPPTQALLARLVASMIDNAAAEAAASLAEVTRAAETNRMR
jgi:hypothetical protein